MAKKNKAHVFDFTGILNAEINQQDWKAKKKLLEDQFGKFKMALDTDLAEAEAQKVLDMFNEKLNLQLNVDQVRKDAEAVKKIIETALASINNIDTSALRGIEDTLKGIADTTSNIFNKLSENAQKASKKTIASVTAIDKVLQKLGGDFASVQEALDFEVKGSAEKQLEVVRKEQERLNEALKGDDWVERQKALVRYTKAFESYQAKVKNNEKKIPQELSDLYHANIGRAGDAKINLQHIIDRHDQKWSGETGSSGSVNVDTSKLATEKTLNDIFNKLDNLKVSVDDSSGKNNKKPSLENIVDNNDINSVLQNAIQNILDGAFMAGEKYANKELSDETYTYYKDDLIGGMQNHPKIEWSTDIYDILNDAFTNELSLKEIMTILKPFASLKHVDSVPKTNTQPVVNDGTSVAINETALGSAIANALKGVQLNTSTQGEVKASIDATELKGVLHDGTPYDVKNVSENGTEKPATETTLGAIKGVLENINTQLQTDNASLDIINRLDQIVTNTDNNELVNSAQSIVQIITEKGNEIVSAIKILIPDGVIDDNVDYKALLDTLVAEFRTIGLNPVDRDDWSNIKDGTEPLTDGLKDVLRKITLLDANGNPNFKLARNGSFAQAAAIGDENAVIAREAMASMGSGYFENPEKLIPLMKKASDEGAKIARVLGFIEHRGSLIELQEKAPGKNVTSDNTEEWSHATTGQIKELINTLSIMIKNGVYPELTGPNLMYDSKKGFTFIDMFDEQSAEEFYSGTDVNDVDQMAEILTQYFGRQTRWSGPNENDNVRQGQYEFADKLINALNSFGLSTSTAEEVRKNIQRKMSLKGQTPQAYSESEEDKKMPEREQKKQEQGRGGFATEQTLSSIKTILEGMGQEDKEIDLSANSIKAVIDGVKTITPQTDTNAPWATEDTLTNGTNKKLEDIKNALKGMVMMPKPKDDAQLSTDGADIKALLENLSTSDDGFSPGRSSITYNPDGKPLYGKKQRKRKTGKAAQTLKEDFKFNKNGDPELVSYEVTNDTDKLIAEQNKLKEKQASMLKDLAQFDNKALGLGDLFEGYDKLQALLKSDNFGDNELQQAKLLLEQLNQEYNELTKMARKGSPSLNPFVNMVNGKDKLESTIRGIKLSFQSLQEQPPELKTKIDKLLATFADWSKIKFDGTEQENAERLKLMAEKYGEIKTLVNGLKSEISNANKEQKLHQKAVKALLDDYRKLGELDVQKELATGADRAAIEEEIRGTQMLLDERRVALGVDKTETDAARAEAMAARNEQIRVDNVNKLLKLTKELGEQEARAVKLQEGSQQAQDAQTNINRLQQEIANIREKCDLTEEELRLLSEVEDANKRLLKTARAKQTDKEETKSLNERIKAERKAARINASNTKWNAGQNALLDLWKIDDDSINVGALPAVKQLEKALNDLTKAQKRADDAIRNNTKDAPAATKSLKDHSKAVASLTADVKELISNYERFSGSNATELGGFAGGDWEQQVTAAIEAQYPGARIKSINHDLQEVTYELKTGARAFTEYTAGVRQADRKIMALKGTTRKLPTFLEGVKKKLGEISQYFSAMSLISRAMQELRKGLQYVKEIDLALTELKKVTDETEETYDKFLQTAAKTGARLGTTISAVIEATATFAKLGYTMREASEMAEAAIVYKNVGDGIASTEDAADSIISTLKGFGMEASETMRIVDRFNEVGNRFAITSKGIGEALRLSASALNEGGNSLDESIALITAANEVVNDPSSVGTALKTKFCLCA